MAGLGGLDWLDSLVKDGKAVDLGGNGYPVRYTAAAADILPLIASGPPKHSGPPVFSSDYILPAGWIGEVRIDHAKIAQCPRDAQLSIEAWDQS
jgi:hypothetical protein